MAPVGLLRSHFWDVTSQKTAAKETRPLLNCRFLKSSPALSITPGSNAISITLGVMLVALTLGIMLRVGGD